MYRAVSSLLPVLLVLLALSCRAEVGPPSVVLASSRFHLVATVSAGDANLFTAAAQAGLLPTDQAGSLTGSPRGTVVAGGRVWHGSNGVGLVSYDREQNTCRFYYLQERGVVGHHLKVPFADDDYVFLSYGARENLPGVAPALEVCSLKRDRFATICAVTSRGARLGSFSYEALRRIDPTSPGPQMCWDDRRWANTPLIDLVKASLWYPEAVACDSGAYVLSYHVSWGVPEFVTQLRFSKADLAAAFAGLGAPPAAGPVP